MNNIIISHGKHDTSLRTFFSKSVHAHVQQICGQLKSGGTKPENIPVWYAIYEAFPPSQCTIDYIAIQYPIHGRLCPNLFPMGMA